ncbi:MAG: insulinase family protein, partial [Bacteroidales bacterium]|nr:insulinase family protein [Bacteroidales bacterium]
MKSKLILRSIIALLLISFVGCNKSKYNYEEFPNDPLNAKIYTLQNGLKVYMTVNKETPRIQTYIAVKVGGKNDPKETTGLAHYFEHLMFKGTKQYGTFNYAAEEPLLQAIEDQFEIYRNTEDESERNRIYQTIDSLSFEASKFAIPNEYDKLMTAIGAKGTNAYTGFDQTVYVEDIPSNQIENWARIQADRFNNNIIRGFHTELETVYEEKNMSLTNDFRKVYEKVLASLYPHHPYGTQTVLGTQEHLKNPSIVNIKEYYKTWYVPNNMAICLSGDFEPDEMVNIIEKYFGNLQPNPNLPTLESEAEPAITSPIIHTVLGLDAENISLAWRLPALNHPDYVGLEVLSYLLYNGEAGLIDLNLNQQQKVLGSFAGTIDMADGSVFLMQARPKEGQSLDEIKTLLLEQVELLRKGDFDEKMLKAVINNLKLEQMYSFEDNRNRADYFVSSFINDLEWKEVVSRFSAMEKLTVDEIKDLTNKYFKDNNYAVIYKRTGTDPDEIKMPKPEITPIVMNRDSTSDFLKEIQASEVTPIEPVFLDFNTDLTHLSTSQKLPIIYKQNVTNDLFQLFFVFDFGKNHIKELGTAFDYLDFLGTSDLSAEDIKKAFYQLACSY